MVGRSLRELDGPTAQALMTLASVEEFGVEQSYSVLPLGIEATTNVAGNITSVHLHSSGHEGFRAFPFEYRGITFDSSRGEVQQRLGTPDRSGAGRTGPWDIYNIGCLQVHFMYSSTGESIVMVTVTT